MFRPRSHQCTPPPLPSSQVLHLLTQMLQPDPARRIPMSAIMEHPWFRAGLPPAALTMNTALVRQQAQQAAAGTATSGEQVCMCVCVCVCACGGGGRVAKMGTERCSEVDRGGLCSSFRN